MRRGISFWGDQNHLVDFVFNFNLNDCMRNSLQDKRLAHLSEEEISQLLLEYFETDVPVSDLIEKYELAVTPSKLSSILPPEILPEHCPYCLDEKLVVARGSRTGYSWQTPRAFCPSCGHGKREPCRCGGCKSWRAEQTLLHKERIEAAVQAVQRSWRIDIAPSDVQFEVAVGILGLVRHSVGPDYAGVSPFQTSPVPLGPSETYTKQSVELLYHRGFLEIGLSSDESSLIFSEDLTQVVQYRPTAVSWEFMPANSLEERKQFVFGLEEIVSSGNWPEHWYDDVDHFWIAICVQECLHYFGYLLKQRYLEADRSDERLDQIIRRALKKFCPAQVCNLLWQSARDTVDFMATKGIPDRQAHAVCRGIFDRKVDKFVAEGWELRKSRRDFNCPQSVIASVFFHQFMQSSGDGFDTAPPVTRLE